MEKKGNKSMVHEPDMSYGHYSYADYLTWIFRSMLTPLNRNDFEQ